MAHVRPTPWPRLGFPLAKPGVSTGQSALKGLWFWFWCLSLFSRQDIGFEPRKVRGCDVWASAFPAASSAS